jgi:hypothetical protein
MWFSKLKSVNSHMISAQITLHSVLLPLLIDNIFQTLSDYLRPKICHNASLKEKDLDSSDVRVDRLVSSLAITRLIAYYKLDLTYFQLTNIIHCLVLQTTDNGRCDFDEIHKHFPEEMWRYGSINTTGSPALVPLPHSIFFNRSFLLFGIGLLHKL